MFYSCELLAKESFYMRSKQIEWKEISFYFYPLQKCQNNLQFTIVVSDEDIKE